MNNKNKIIIKSSLKLYKLNEIKYKILKMQPNIEQINNQFTADYVLNVDLGLLENFVNFNQFFNVATYDQNNIVQLEINREFIDSALFNSSSFIKFDNIDANPDVVNNEAYSKLNTNNTNLNYRFLEILSTKIFGDPTLKDLILNQEPFYEVIDGINSVLIDSNTTTEILNTYSELPVYVIPTNETNFNFRNTVWDFPMYLSGHILDTLGVESNTFNGPNMGGSVITNGIYNIPIILRFYGVSTRKIVVGGRGKNSNNILAYSYNAFDWINVTLPELNKDYFRQINACLYIPNLWLAGGLAFNDGSNNIMTSTDGITWNYIESENVVSNIMSLATNDTILVARYIIGALNTNGSIYSPNTVLYSYNNKDWFNSPSGSELFSFGLLNVKYNGSIWVGVGIGTTGGIIGYSLDGTEWIKSTSGSKNLDMYAYDIVWNGTIWVAVGRGNSSIIYSSNGINWSISTSGTNLLNPCSAITWDGIKFIAGGDSIIYSSNGIEWTASNTTLFSSINNIYSKVVISPLSTIVIASGTISNDLEQAQLAYSTDNGVTWTETINTISNEQAVTSTYWNGTYWLGSVISNNDETIIIYSDDGITWENTNTYIFSPNGYCSNLSWNGLQWTAVGFNLTDNLVFTSKDGYNWILSSASSLIVSGRCTSYANILPKIIKRETSDLIVASGSGNFDLMIGVDGLYWYGINLFFQTNSVIWIGNKWICGGPDGFGYSDDGLNWLPNNTIPFIVGTVNVIQWNGFMLVAGTNNGACSILYSFDGITWFPSFQINSILEPSYGIYSLTWANNKWVAGTINPRKQILSVIDPNSYDFNYGNDCTKTIDNDFTTSWDPISGYNLYQLVFTFDNDTKINCLNCFCSAVDNTDNLITGIQIEYLDSNSNYQSILNTTLSISDFTIKESFHLFEANFDLVLTNSIRISFQKSTPYQIFITEVQFFEIINSILYSVDGINWSSSNSSKGKFKEQVNSIIWDGNEIVATSNSLNEDNESILNYSNDLVNWTAPSSISNIFIANTSLSTDYRGYYNFINRELIVPLSFNVYITDLNKQEISYTFNDSIDYYNVQYVDSDAFTLLGDLSSNLVTIESTINLTNEHSYWGILSGIKDNYVNSIYFKFWSFNYTDLSVTVVDSSSNYVYTFSFSVGNLGFDNQINKSMGIGIIDISNTLIHTFPIPISNNNYFEITIDFLDTDLKVYLTNNTTYSFCVIGEFYQPDFSTLYTIRTTSNSTFLFTSSTIINPDIDPLSIKSLSLWLDGSDPNGDGTSITDSSTINIWYDKSGYNRNAIAQNFPSSSVAIIKNNIRNSLPIIRCNGTQRYFVNYPSFPNTNYTIFTVQLCNADNLRGYQRLVSGSSHDFSIFVGVKGTNICTFTGSANESWNDTNENSPSIDNMGSWKIVSVVVDNSVLTPYVNGTAQNTKVGTTQPFNNLYICGANLGMDDLQYWNGDIADIMIFNETLSQIDRQKIEGYLAWKWGLQSDLPNDHLYEQSFNPLVQPNLQNFIPHNNLPPLILLKAINYSGSGNWNDESGNEKNATLSTGTIAKNTEGNGIVLDGSTAWTFQNVAVGNAWSANVWFKLTSNPEGTWPGILTQLIANNQANLMIGGNNNSMAVSFFDSGWFSGGVFNLTVNKWINIQSTWDGTNMITYINGISLSVTTPGGIAIDSGQAYLIGRDWNNDAFINGEIGEVRIYNYALTQEEVTTDYNESLSTFIWQPTLITGCQLWLDGADKNSMILSGDEVTQWNDKIGSYNANSGNNPTSIGNGVNFNGSDNYMNFDISVPLNSTITCFFVTTVSSMNEAYLYNSNNQTVIIMNYNSPYPSISQFNVAGNTDNIRSDFFPPGTSIPIINLYNYTRIENSSDIGYYMGSQAFNLQDFSETQPTSMSVLGCSSPGINHFGGTIYEMIFYNNALTNLQRQIVEGYLAWKWNIQTNLPTNHPFYNSPPSHNQPLINGPLLLLKAINYNGSGDWIDESNNGYNATLEAGTIAKNTTDNGIILDGSTSWTFPNILFNNMFTINVWYKQTAPTVTGYIITQINTGSINAFIGDYLGQGNGSYECGFAPGDWNYGTPFTLTNNVWTNIQLTWDGTNLNTYINSVLSSSVPQGVSMPTSNAAYRIGAAGYGSFYVVGEIGEVRIYNYALTQEEVTTDYQSSYNDFHANIDTNIDPNSLPYVKLYVNSKDTDNIELENNQIISITNKTNILTASTLRPIYSNHSILFNQSNSYLTLDGSIINNATSYCMFFAFKINSLTNPTILFYKQHDFQSTLSVKIVDGFINFHFNDVSTNWYTYSNITVSINTIYILTIIWNGTNLVFRINGSLDSSNIGGNFNIPDDSSPTFTRIGSGSAWNLYDFIYCDSLISLENINILEGFLAWKWNLQVNLPFNHEYKKRIPLNTDILPFKPTSLSNLNLWLDAGDITTIDLSDNVITHWYDKSGFGNNGIAINNPIYDASSNSIRLDGSSNYIATTYTSFSPNETAFIVFNSNSTSQQALIDTNSIEGRAYQIVELGPSIANSGVNWLIYSTIPSVPNTTYIGEYNYNSNGMNLILNGTPAGSNNTNPNFSDGITTIGYGYSGIMLYFSGTISEVIIYNTVLSPEDSQKVEGYLAWKWGLVSSLPSDHPYKNTPINPLIPNDFSPYSSDSVNTWLDGSDLSNMFADISLNTVITNNNQKIALWRDKSPNTYYFKQSANNLGPTVKLNSLTNLPLVTFNNNILKSYPMPFFTSANSGGTFFFVFDSNSSSATTLLGYQNQTTGTFNNSETFIGYSFNNRINRFGFSRNGGMSTNTNNITIDSSYNLISSVMKNSGGSPSNILINKNGNSETVSNISSGYYSASRYPYQNNSVAVTIGGAHVRDISENLLQSGNIAEIIWFNYPLTSSEIQKIEGYLAWKWSLQSNLPSSHPFYSGSPTLHLKYAEFSPSTIEGINLWLDAKDLWKDKSGNGLIVTAHGSPTLTEDNLFSFNGTNQYFSIPYSGDHSTETGFVIIKFNNTDGEQDIICGDNGGRQYHNYNGDIRIASAGVTGGITNPTTPPEVSTLALLEYTITPTEINLYQNGTLLSTSPVSVTMGNESFINIGVNFALSSNTYFNGYIGEVILFNSVLSEIDRNKIEGYLAWKWGIEYNLPNDHPYINYKTPPQLLPLPDQNVNMSITLSNYTPHLNDSVTFTAEINGIYKFVSSTWTLNSTIVSKNTGSFITTFNQEINYTIEFTLVTVNNTYMASYSLYIIANLPSQLPNLKVWLDGTDNKTITLDSWTDKSTNAYLFTGSNTAPSRTNLSFHFYERNNYFSYDPIVFNNANTYTFMMIAEFGNLRQFLGLNSEIVLGIGRPGLIEPGLNQPPARPGILYWNTHTQGSLANSIIPLQRNKKYIIIITYDGNNLIFKINGQIYSTTNGDFKIIDDLGVNLPWLGNWSFYNTINDWKLYDFIYTNSVTSMIEIIKMEGYFADKWNLQSDLPSDHPYKLTIPESISFNSFSPNSFSGLNLWLDASYTSSITLSDNNVTIWSDRRNNGISAISGTSPTYNSTNKSIQFDSSQTQYLNLPDGTIPSGNSAYSIFIVISTSIDPSIPQWFISGGSNEFILGSHFSSSTIANSWGYQSELYANININANQIYIVELFYNQTTRSIYFNGILIVSDVPGVRNNNIYNNKIGDGTFGQPLNGNIFEIIIYNKQVTTDERVQIEGYLAWKWNLQSYLPNNHNFKNVSPNDLDLNVMTSLSVDNENPILGDTVNLTITKLGYYPLVSENWILNGDIVASNTSSYSQTYSTEGPYLLSYNLNTVNGNYTQEFNKII